MQPSTKHPKIFGITLDLKLTFLQHINITITKAKQKLNILNAFTKWSEQKKLIISIIKAITCLILEHENTIWSLIISNTNIKKLQTIQNTGLHNVTGCTQDTNTQHQHNKTRVLLMDTHLKLHAIQLKPPTQTQTHHIHDFNAYSDSLTNIKATIFHNNECTNMIIIIL